MLKKKLTAALLGTALAITANASLPSMASAQSNNTNYVKISNEAIGTNQRVKVGLNKSIVIDLPREAHDILVADPNVADAITRTSTRLYIFAKQVGTTNLFIFDIDGNQLLSLDLQVERDTAGLEENLARFIPGSNIKVEIVNDNIILTGTVPTPQASARAIQLANAFLSGGEATTNQFATQNTFSGGGIFFDQDEARRSSQIVNLLQIDGEDQVHLKVTVAEIQRTIVKQLGIDLTAAGLTVGNIAAAGVFNNPFGLGNEISGTNIQAQYSSSGGETVDGILRALNSNGVARTLAEPSLTAISGETATFSVGGEYNVPDGRDFDDAQGVTLNFRQVEYGVGLSFTPVVLSPGRISLRIRTEVSEPTVEGNAALSGGGNQPGVSILSVRRREAETTVELPSGGSMVLAGLLRDDVRQVAAGFPGLSKVPVLGTLFRSRDYQRQETELVIIATPYLVRPTARKNIARPDDNFAPTSDGAANFLGRLNRVYGQVEGKLPEGEYHGKVGFILK